MTVEIRLLGFAIKLFFWFIFLIFIGFCLSPVLIGQRVPDIFVFFFFFFPFFFPVVKNGQILLEFGLSNSPHKIILLTVTIVNRAGYRKGGGMGRRRKGLRAYICGFVLLIFIFWLAIRKKKKKKKKKRGSKATKKN